MKKTLPPLAPPEPQGQPAPRGQGSRLEIPLGIETILCLGALAVLVIA